MLWDKGFKLGSFFSAESATAPCLAEGAPGSAFLKAAMNSNRSCEHYVGRVKNIHEHHQIKDNANSDSRITGIIVLQDLESLSIKLN